MFFLNVSLYYCLRHIERPTWTGTSTRQWALQPDSQQSDIPTNPFSGCVTELLIFLSCKKDEQYLTLKAVILQALMNLAQCLTQSKYSKGACSLCSLIDYIYASIIKTDISNIYGYNNYTRISIILKTFKVV